MWAQPACPRLFFGYDMAIVDFFHQVNVAVTYDGTIKWWFQHVMGSSAAVIADSGTLIALGETPVVQAMPLYPANGYCAMVDGTAVIKLSD